MDSISSLMLVEYLEKTFNISFEPHEVTAENLDSLNIIEAFVNQKQVSAKAA
jgi:acyl carrier protein